MTKHQKDASWISGAPPISEASKTFLANLKRWLKNNKRRDLEISFEPPLDHHDDGGEIAVSLKSHKRPGYLTIGRYRDAYDANRIYLRGASINQGLHLTAPRGVFEDTVVVSVEGKRTTDKMLFAFLDFACSSHILLDHVFIMQYGIAVQYCCKIDAESEIRFARRSFIPDLILRPPIFRIERVPFII
jgi:hypothetical protein